MPERNPEREAQQARAAASWNQWQEHEEARAAERRAAQAPPPAPAPPPSMRVNSLGPDVRPPRVDPTYAWTTALLPLTWLLVAYFAPEALTWAWLPLVGVAVLLCALDRRRIRAETGIELAPSDLLIVPVYLIDRTRKLHSTPAIPVVWFVATGVALLSMFTFAASYQFDGDGIEPQITKWIKGQGIDDATVDCPNTWVHEGKKVTCTVIRPNGKMTAVYVQLDSDGFYTWGWTS
jgi:hypothetical protein